MENQQEKNERTGVLGGVAKILNAGGGALVDTYDITMGTFDKVFSVLQKAPAAPLKAFDLTFGSTGLLKPDEIKKLEVKIGGYEKKIKRLYYSIGKEGTQLENVENPFEDPAVKKLMADVHIYQQEIKRLEKRIQDIKDEKREKVRNKKE